MAKRKKTNNADQFPQTVEAAVELLISRMTPDMKAWLLGFDEEMELEMQLYASFTTGMDVRAMLGLWGQNPVLTARIPIMHPDSASRYFLIKCWQRLRDEHAAPDRKASAY